MIPYIDMQLNVWGRWALRQERGALGYPSVSQMFREARCGGSYKSREPFGIDEYVGDTDLAVRRLNEADRQLCVQRYQLGGTADEVSARMGIGKSTLFRRIDAVHQALMGLMNDIAAEHEVVRRNVAEIEKRAVDVVGMNH